jgi:bifunctional non-homologous end joining protein LigD
MATPVGVQLATLVAEAPAGDDWLHEVKFDGFRILARRQARKVTLSTRSGQDWTAGFAGIAAAVALLPGKQAVLDGEVVVFEADGRTRFQALQNARGTDAAVYVVFDLLERDGRDLRPRPLEERKRELAELLRGAPAALRVSEHVVGGGAEQFEDACRRGLEGIVSKRRDAPYEEGRSRSWLKVKCVQRQELVIGGFTDPAGSRVGFGALLFGAHDEEGHLRYVGRVGTGFPAQLLVDLRRRLDGLVQSKSPFAEGSSGRGKGTHFVRPELVAEVEYAELTRDGILRHGRFVGLRSDKPAREVKLERPQGAE